MTDQIPEELKAEMEAVEHEAAEATQLMQSQDPRAYNPPAALPFVSAYGSPTPLSDLRERLALLQAACVDSYEDGPLKMRFNLEHRRELLRPTEKNERW